MTSLPKIMLTPLVENALREDLGANGDITTLLTIPNNHSATARIIARQNGVIAGLDLANLAFKLLDPELRFERHKHDGEIVKSGEIIATITAKAQSILSAERVALNFLGHLSGVATVTQQLVQAAKPHRARIACTRKTTPGLRTVEKYAVRMGGGYNHRFGLYDAVLIKDNHIAIAGGIEQCVTQLRSQVGHLVKIEIEVDTLEQLNEVLALLPTAPVDVVLLDNMNVEQLSKAVSLVDGRLITEASGGITIQSVNRIAATGVDIISVGWITHSAPVLDLGLDI